MTIDPSHLVMAEERIIFLQRALIERDAEIQRLLRLMKGWSSYAWKDGQYIDDVQSYFDDALYRGTAT